MQQTSRHGKLFIRVLTIEVRRRARVIRNTGVRWVTTHNGVIKFELSVETSEFCVEAFIATLC